MATIQGTGGNDTIAPGGNSAGVVGGLPSAAGDSIAGLAGNDRVDGGGGDDTLDGGDGDDVLVGGLGNDLLLGGLGADAASYGTSSGGIVGSLTTGLVNDGMGGTDTLVGVERIWGSDFDDGITGSSLAARNAAYGLFGAAGNDTIFGLGFTWNNADHYGEDGSVRINLSAGALTLGGVLLASSSGQDASGGINTFVNVVAASGSNIGDDTIQGGAASEWLNGNGGNDNIDSGDGNDTLIGGDGDDSVTGGNGDDAIIGGNGYDTISGGSGANYLDYSGFAGPIRASYGSSNYSGFVGKGGGITDSFTGIRLIIGTAGDDVLVGSTDTAANLPYAILLRGIGGNDTIDGVKSQLNQANYFFAPGGVTINLQTSLDAGGNWFGTASGIGSGVDTLRNVVRAIGSNYADAITGSAVGDRFDASEGNDTYNGGGGNNTVDYATTGSSGVTFAGIVATFAAPPVGLYTFTDATVVKTSANGGAISTDSLTEFNVIRGTAGADTFYGLAATVLYSFNNTVMRGNAGNDTFYGFGNGFNRVDYAGASHAVSLDLQTGLDVNGNPIGAAGDDGNGGVDTLYDVRSIQGSGFDDILLGSFKNDTFSFGSGGVHAIDGRGGSNDVRFTGTVAVIIDLAQHTLAKPAGIDTLTNIQNAQGGGGNDIVLGDGGTNFLSGGIGDNAIDGRGGNDWLTYRPFTGLAAPTHGASIDLADGINGTAINPWGGADTLTSIENAVGSQWNDTITGAALPDRAISYIRGDGGNDALRAGTLETGVTADYAGALEGVVVDLALQRTLDDGWFGGEDTLENIRSVRGSSHDDALFGSAGRDRFDGALGDDRILGRKGNDLLIAGAGDDTVFGNGNNDSLFGAAGNDDLHGGFGRDTLAGGLGDDTLRGDAGADSFRFVGLTDGRDQIADFTAGEDVIELVAGGFAGLAAGPLDPARFFAGPSGLAAPGTTGPCVCYDTQTGLLVFDENGRDDGGRFVLAHLWGAPVVTAGEISVIG